MNGLSTTWRRGALMVVAAAGWLGAESALAQQPAPAPRAQRQITVRVDTNAMQFTVIVDGIDSLVRSLAQSRQLEERIGMALREYGKSQRTTVQRQALEEQLQKLAASNVALMSKIEMACTSKRTADRAPEGYLGVTFNIMGSIKRENNGPEVYRFDEPPEIVTIEPGSPAERAGMRRGDRVVAFDGRDLVGRDVVLSTMLVPGRRLAVKLAREGRDETVNVVVQKRPGGFGDECANIDLIMPLRAPLSDLKTTQGQRMTYLRSTPRAPETPVTPATPPTPAAPPAPPTNVWTFEAPPPVAISGFSSVVAGAQLTTLTDDFKELTGADHGVMVQRVAPETPAAVGGLKGGDVIVEAAGRPVTSARFLQRLISDADDRALELKVVRKGKTRTVWLKW